jgi:NhaP-type Na+/H+ or K+/H+ antiporter
VWFSGLRGAVAYASANLYPDTTGHASEMAATTTVIIIYTLYVHGGMTIQMCHWLGIQTGVDAAAMSAKVSGRKFYLILYKIIK